MPNFSITFTSCQHNTQTLDYREIPASLEQANNATMDAYKTIPIGKLSSLQEDETCYYVTAVIKTSSDHVERAIVVWPKESFESWLSRAENRWADTAAASGYYTLPV